MQNVDERELPSLVDTQYRLTTVELLARAKDAIHAGEASLRRAADDLAAAQTLGMSQRLIGQAVGKSAAWVNQLLKWRESGYRDTTPFGPQSKASRKRASHVQSAEHRTGPSAPRRPGTLALPSEHIRRKLIKALGMLGSEHPGERAAAAVAVETLRATLDRQWEALIIPMPPANGL